MMKFVQLTGWASSSRRKGKKAKESEDDRGIKTAPENSGSPKAKRFGTRNRLTTLQIAWRISRSRPKLEHREHDDPVFKLPRGKARPRHLLQLRPVLMKITKGLLVCLKCRCEPAHLSSCAERKRERYCSVAV
nr:hypothetical protein [Bradyrhizobium sp. NAS96.2]